MNPRSLPELNAGVARALRLEGDRWSIAEQQRRLRKHEDRSAQMWMLADSLDQLDRKSRLPGWVLAHNPDHPEHASNLARLRQLIIEAKNG